jgi:hypothetical protein
MANTIPYFDLKALINSTPAVIVSENVVVGDISNNVVSQPKATNRCGAPNCKRKLLLTDITCRCGVRCCMTHRDATQHDCKHDFKAEGKAVLEKNLVKVSNDSLKNRI